jgi:hypothetical protein
VPTVPDGRGKGVAVGAPPSADRHSMSAASRLSADVPPVPGDRALRRVLVAVRPTAALVLRHPALASSVPQPGGSNSC